MIYFYYGDDSYRSKQTVDALKEKFKKTYDPQEHNVEIIHADEFTLEKFFTAIKSSGFLSPKKFILVRNLFSIKSFAEIQDAIITYLKTLKNTTDENYIVIWQEGSPRVNLKLFKQLNSICTAGCCQRFDAMSAEQAVQWAKNEAIKFGKQIDMRAAELLVSFAGSDAWALYQQIRKLCYASDRKTVSVEDVYTLVNDSSAIPIFALVDAIGEKNEARALELLQEAFEKGAEEQYLLAMIARQFRLLAQVKDASDETRNAFSIAKKLSLPEFVAKKILNQSAGYSRAELIKSYEALSSIDILLRLKPEYAKTALTIFIIERSHTTD